MEIPLRKFQRIRRRIISYDSFLKQYLVHIVIIEFVKDNDRWDVVDLPDNFKLIGCGWVFKAKGFARSIELLNPDWC